MGEADKLSTDWCKISFINSISSSPFFARYPGRDFATLEILKFQAWCHMLLSKYIHTSAWRELGNTAGMMAEAETNNLFNKTTILIYCLLPFSKPLHWSIGPWMKHHPLAFVGTTFSIFIMTFSFILDGLRDEIHKDTAHGQDVHVILESPGWSLVWWSWLPKKVEMTTFGYGWSTYPIGFP